MDNNVTARMKRQRELRIAAGWQAVKVWAADSGGFQRIFEKLLGNDALRLGPLMA